MGYNTTELSAIGQTFGWGLLGTAIINAILIYLSSRDIIKSATIVASILIFIVFLPLLILSTIVNGIMVETEKAVAVPCPSYCNNSDVATGTTVSSLNPGPIAFGCVFAFAIGVVLFFAHRMHDVPEATMMGIYAFLFAVILVPGMTVSTVVNYAIREKIQRIMAAGDCSKCTA